MNPEVFVVDLLIVLAAGLLSGLVCKRIGVSLLVGYLVVGAMIGNGALSLVTQENHELEYLARAGALLLLFSVGIEFSLEELVRLSRYFLIGGAVQMVLVAVPLTAACLAFGMTWNAAILAGFAGALSSTVLVFKALAEWGQAASPHGRRAIGILLFQDVALVPLMLLIPLLTKTGEPPNLTTFALLAGKSLIFVAAVLLARTLIGRWVVLMIARLRSVELVVLFAMSVLGGVCWGAFWLGLPPAIGALAAGMMLSGNRLSKQFDTIVLPFRETFAAVFFVTLGTLLNPLTFFQEPLLLTAGLAGILVLKTAAAALVLKLIGLRWPAAMGMGLGLAQLGEFSFLVLAEGVSQDVISSADYNRMLFVALGTLILTPQLLKLGLRWTGETILIVNTVANTAGAAMAGAQARLLFGEVALIWFSLAFTLCVLFFSEIFPKVVGVAYSHPVSRAIAIPWAAGIAMLFPVIWLIEKLSRVLKPGHTLSAPEDEVHQLAMISAEEGSIMPYEAVLVRNVLHLDKVTTRDIMTPRPVVMKLASDMTLADVFEKTKEFTYSRIPVYDCEDPEMWKGVVFSRDILSALAKDQFETKVEALCSPIYFVSEKTPGHVLLKSFLKRRTHLFGVSDEYGDITGIVTLEDVIESMLGEEIVDEVDSAVDMQEVAQRRKRDRIRNASDVSNEGNQNDTAS